MACAAHASLPIGTPNRRRVISPSSSLTRRAGGDRVDSPQTEGDATPVNGVSGGIGPTGWRVWSLDQGLIPGGSRPTVLYGLILSAAPPARSMARPAAPRPG